jgi:predicted enzyme related to lactoylglutathione lyase
MEKRVVGLGGIFFKTNNPNTLKNWYQKHLGLQVDAYGTTFEWRKADKPTQKGFTQWSPMESKTTYFSPSENEFMVNYRVENLEALLVLLREEGVTILDEIETFEYGKFLHILDPEGRKIELWEPNDVIYDTIVEARTK